MADGQQDAGARAPEGAAHGQGALPQRAPRRRAGRRAESVYDLPPIPGYRLEGVLGSGATGTVYSAVQEAVDRPVAIKFLHPELCTNRRTVARLRREARVTARLGHPGIVTAIDMGEAEGRWWYAMELVEGISLGERVTERGPLEEREAIRLFVPLVDALRHCHEMGVVHRDVKPANILVDESGRARLADLGLAWAEADPRVTGEDGALGTPHYMSPEHARDAAAVDQRSDLWSLGATLFHALVGRPPFVGRSAAEVLAGVLHQRIPDPRSLAPELSRGMALVLRKCLTRDPAGRYPDALALLKDLERLRERRAPRIRAGELDPVAGSTRTMGGALRAAGLVALGAGAVLAWRTSVGSPEPAPEVLPWAPLEELAAQLDSGSVPLRTIDERLALMQRGGADAPLPPEQRPRAGALRLRWGSRMADEVGAGLDLLEQGLDEALERGDLVLAQRTLTEAWPAELERRTGYSLVSQWPPAFTGAAAARARLEACGQRFQAGRGRWLDETIAALDRHRDAVRLPAALRAADGGAYAAGLASLGPPDETWLEAAGVSLDGIPAALAAEALGASRLAEALASDRAYLRSRWRSVDAELVALVLREEQVALQALVSGRPRALMGFEEAWRAACGAGGLRAEEVPAGEAWRSAALYERTLERLRAEEADERVLRARSLLEDDLARAAELAADRRYADLVLLWEAELAAPLLASVRPEIQARLDEARACAGAIGAVTALLDGGGVRTLTLRGVPRTGRVVPEGAQGEAVFQLREVEGGAVHRFALRRTALAADLPLLDGLELIALLEEARPQQEPAWRVPVLLLLAEGRPQAALQTLASHPPDPDESADLTRLRERVQLEAEVRSAVGRRERERFAMRLEALRAELADGASPAELVLRLEALATTYDGVLGAGEREALQSLRVDLAPQPSVREQVLAAAQRVELEDGRVRLVLGLSAEAGWLPGLWRSHSEGLTLVDALPGDAAFEGPAGAATLELSSLLDPAAEIRVRWTLERLEPFLPRTLVGLSLGQHHLVLAGQGSEQELRLLRGPLPGAWSGLEGGAPGLHARFDGLPRTQPLEVTVVLAPGGNELDRVLLDGRRVALTGRRGREPVLPGSRLELRSLAPLRVIELVVEGRLLP